MEMYSDTDSDEVIKVDELKKNGMLLKYILEQTEELCLIAVKQNSNAIIHVKKPTEAIMLATVKQNGMAIKYIKDPSDKICEIALIQNPLVLQYIKYQTIKMIKIACKKNPVTVSMIKKPSKELYYELISDNIETFKYMDNKFVDDEFIMFVWEKCVTSDGLSLMNCTNQTMELCKIAIEQNSNAIQYINESIFTKKQIIELQLMGIVKNPMVIKYVMKPTKEQIETALLQNGIAIKYIQNPSYDHCKLAIKQNKSACESIKDNYYKYILNDNLYEKSSKEIDPCSICYSDESHFIKFNCNHVFCRDCAIKINKCPMCSRNTTTYSLIKN